MEEHKRIIKESCDRDLQILSALVLLEIQNTTNTYLETRVIETMTTPTTAIGVLAAPMTPDLRVPETLCLWR
jgi:hypothetical protein